MPLRHYVAPNAGGTEILSVCERHRDNLGKCCREVSADKTFPHRSCDLCEMLDDGRLPFRLADLEAKGIVVYQRDI